jgi:myo-inositol-1(or 4)-monophosphatase
VSTQELQQLRDFATDLAVSAGEIIRRERPPYVEVLETKSSEVDPVTAMDRLVEEYLVRRIRAERPQDGILGEEGDSLPGTSGLTWVIDPVDGTVNYLYGIASWAVSVAVVTGPVDPELWEVQAGAVHAVVPNKTWSAALGMGATVNGKPIVQRPAPSLAKSLVATGFGYDAKRRLAQVKVLEQIIGHIRDIRRLGAASIDLCLQAEGLVDLYYERGLHPWDLAAGTLIATEAGSTVCGLRGRRAAMDMAVVGRGPALAELVQLLEAAGADDPNS